MTLELANAKVSFRDPAGRVIRVNDRIFRVVGTTGLQSASFFLDSPVIQKQIANGSVVRTWKATANDAERACAIAGVSPNSLVLEHERIAFPSFPYEWPREMLYEAAELTLSLCDQLMAEGISLKDATPFNVLFRGTKPVFVDVLSVEKRDANDPVWLAYAQFLTTFILPLLATRELGITLDQVFMSRREGLKPEELNQLLGFSSKLKPAVMFNVVLPTLLGRSSRSESEEVYRKRTVGDPELAVAHLRHLFSALRRKLRGLKPSGERVSQWADYERQNSYSDAAAKKKWELVQATLQRIRPKTVLDVGCNRGAFSRLASSLGASVVAIDSDPVVVGHAYMEAKREGADVLPLVVDISRPSPAVGWMNEECASFLERATKSFDLVLMLAIVHHLIVTERIPLEQVLAMVARITNDAAVVEFISTKDPMFKKLVRGRDHLYEGFTEDAFEEACKARFKSVDREPISETRSLYVLRDPIA
jgi:SAM-dependent methyltransferase